MLTQIPVYFQIVWDDYNILDQTTYDTQIDITDVRTSNTARDVALNFSRYNAYNGTGYGERIDNSGITEQQAYDDWITVWDKQDRKVRQDLVNLEVYKITQNQYDGLVLYNWIMGNTNTVLAEEGEYDLKQTVKNQDWDIVANMIARSLNNRDKTDQAAKIIALADYGEYKDRSWLRTQGIYRMRQQNELLALDSTQVKRARFAYYAETGNFLPFTPEGVKRDIVKKYADTLIQQNFIYDGTTSTFTLQKSPSLYPVEKIQVQVNGTKIPLYFDYTVDGRTLTITKKLEIDDVIRTTIKI